MRPIYWGKLHTETPDYMRRMRLKGEIPEVANTYRYFNVAYPAMNEKGLAIGETTFGKGSVQVLYDNYLSKLEEPEDLEYYMCGPPLMTQAVLQMLYDLGVERDNILLDDFGG